VTFDVADDIRVGDRSEAAIKTNRYWVQGPGGDPRGDVSSRNHPAGADYLALSAARRPRPISPATIRG